MLRFAVALLVLVPALAAAQTAGGGRPTGPAAPYDVPRTPWGDPDFQGIWTSDDARGVPLQRPEEFGARAQLTDEEYAQRKQRDDETRGDTRVGAGTFVGEVGTRSLRQTSLVVDPPDGRIPMLTPAARERMAAFNASRNPLLPATWEDRSMTERCISRGVLGIVPTIYGNGLEIVQAPGYVVINFEMVHEARVIPLDGRRRPGPAMQSYMGNASGRWEGNTLVVETANFNDKLAIGGTRYTTALRLRERFTRVAPDVIEYEVIVDDPNTWVRPWTIRLPLATQPGYRLFPFECHEGNQAMRNILSAARAEEKVIEDYVKKGLEPPPLARPGDNEILPPDPSFGRRR